MESRSTTLFTSNSLIIRQKSEMAELFGFETRNKYEVFNDSGVVVGFVAEKKTGFFGFLFRQFLGHWRRFEVCLFDERKQMLAIAKQPFRLWFQTLAVRLPNDEPIGRIQQRFAIFRKRFDILDAEGRRIYKMPSGFWSFWTFRFYDNHGTEIARIEKKWSGLLSEMFTDRDNFRLQFATPGLSGHHRYLLIASALFIDLHYFEEKA